MEVNHQLPGDILTGSLVGTHFRRGGSKINYISSSVIFQFGNRLPCDLELVCTMARNRGIIGLWAEDLRMKRG